MTEKTLKKDAKLVSFRSAVLLQDWITSKALALEERSWIMEQIAEEKYGRLCSQFINSCISSDILVDVATLIFYKAVLEPTFCPMYAQLCYDIHGKLPTFPSADPGNHMITFKMVLLNLCEMVFEGTDELSEEIRKMNAPDQMAERKDKERMLKLRTLGNLRLVGELSLKGMMVQWHVQGIVEKLLGNDEKICPSEENVEAVCVFLKTIGKYLDGSRLNSKINDKYFRHIKNLSNHPQLVMHTRFMVQNIIDLRSNHWVPSQKKVSISRRRHK